MPSKSPTSPQSKDNGRQLAESMFPNQLAQHNNNNNTNPTKSPFSNMAWRKTRYTDFITRDRLRDLSTKQEEYCGLYDQGTGVLENKLQDVEEDEEAERQNANPFANESEDELHRKEFEEFITLRASSVIRTSHLYFKLMKIYRYMNIVNHQGTLIALLSLDKSIKHNPDVVQAVEENDGITILLNLMECEYHPIKLAAMNVLDNLFHFIYFRRMAIAFGVVNVLVELLLDTDVTIQIKACNLLSRLAVLKETRALVSKTKCIEHLVCILDMNTPPITKIVGRYEYLKPEDLKVAAATALWRLSRSYVNRKLMQRAGLVLILSGLINKNHEQLLVPLFGILQGCANDPAFRLSIRTEGILKFLIEHLRTTDLWLKLQCTRTLYHCVEDEQIKEVLSSLGGFDALVAALKLHASSVEKILKSGWLNLDTMTGQDSQNFMNVNNNNNAATLDLASTSEASTSHEVRVNRLRLAKTGNLSTKSPTTHQRIAGDGEYILTFRLLHTILTTISRCTTNDGNVNILLQLGVTEIFVELIELLAPYCLIYYQAFNAISLRLQMVALIERVCGAAIDCLSRMATVQIVRQKILKEKTFLSHLIRLLNHESKDILVATISTLSALTSDPDLIIALNRQHAFRILYSLTQNNFPEVRMAAFQAITAYLNNSKNRMSLLQSVYSSLGNLAQSLTSAYQTLSGAQTEHNVKHAEHQLAAICTTLREVATEPLGRTILTQLGVVPYLINISMSSREECLRIGVSSAIEQFASTTPMIKAFREKPFLSALIEYVRVGSLDVKLSAIRALDKLSTDSVICCAIRAVDITSTLMQLVCDAPDELQEAAAHLIGRVARVGMREKRSEFWDLK